MRIPLTLFLILIWAFLILAPLNAYSEEEWTITKFEKLSYASVSGEVTHGDTLNFFLRTEDNCAKVWNTFTFYTYEKPGDIHQTSRQKYSSKAEWGSRNNSKSSFD